MRVVTKHVTPNPGGNFMAQVTRNLTDHLDGFLRKKKFLILDNDALLAKGFCGTLEDAGVKIVRTAYRRWCTNPGVGHAGCRNRVPPTR